MLNLYKMFVSTSKYILRGNMFPFNGISIFETALFNIMRLKVSGGRRMLENACRCSFNVAALFRSHDSVPNFLSLPLEPRTKKSPVRVNVEICMKLISAHAKSSNANLFLKPQQFVYCKRLSEKWVKKWTNNVSRN
jgi:hypothetical protein